jgi:hypothetical protein
MSGGKMNRRQFGVAYLAVALCVLRASFLAAQKPEAAPVAPIPAQILAAKKVFVANAGGEDRSYEEPRFGAPERAYNQFYAAIKSWGRFELVPAPANADITLQIAFTVQQAEQSVTKGNSMGTPFDPQFRLEIRDPKSNTLLWAFTEHAQWAVLQSNRDRNFDQALAKVVAHLQSLEANPGSAAQNTTKQ